MALFNVVREPLMRITWITSQIRYVRGIEKVASKFICDVGLILLREMVAKAGSCVIH